MPWQTYSRSIRNQIPCVWMEGLPYYKMPESTIHTVRTPLEHWSSHYNYFKLKTYELQQIKERNLHRAFPVLLKAETPKKWGCHKLPLWGGFYTQEEEGEQADLQCALRESHGPEVRKTAHTCTDKHYHKPSYLPLFSEKPISSLTKSIYFFPIETFSPTSLLFPF